MSQSRRALLRSGALALSGLACATVSARASTRSAVQAIDDGSKAPDDLLLEQKRAACPLCATGTICNQHLF